MDQKEFTPQQYKKFNGQSIMLALDAMGGSATAEDLATHIGVMIEQPQDIVKAEVQQVLRRGISNGFFQRRGKTYCLFNGDSGYQVDGKTPKRKVEKLETDGDTKKVRFSTPNDDLDEQTIERLQEIIAKANEETRKASILASEAAERAKLASMKILEMVDNEDSEQDE